MSKELDIPRDLESKKELIKRTVCRDASDDELELFIHVCKRTGLDPFAKQIYAIKRAGTMTIQTGIDGYRLIAERTGKYMPGKEPSFVYQDGKLFSATSYVKKLAPDGSWHEIAATAIYDEYAVTSNSIWKNKPHVMLAKCSESLVLRRAFPSDLSGLYTKDEMEMAEHDEKHPVPIDDKKPIDDLIVACASFETDSISILECIEERRGSYSMEKYAARCLKDIEKFKEFYLSWKHASKQDAVEIVSE